MARFKSPLDEVRVAAPCPADWDQMIGTDRVRFCGQCNLHVYNLSALSKEEAEVFVTRSEGRLCVRFYQRADGSILTSNCPVGLRIIRAKVSRVAQAIGAAVMSFFTGLGAFRFANRISHVRSHTMGAIAARPGTYSMGDFAAKPEDFPTILGRAEVKGQMVRPANFSDENSRGKKATSHKDKVQKESTR